MLQEDAACCVGAAAAAAAVCRTAACCAEQVKAACSCFQLLVYADSTLANSVGPPSEAQERVQACVQGLICADHLPELLWWQPQQLRKVLVYCLYNLLCFGIG